MRKSKEIPIDEAKELKGKLGMTDEEFEKLVAEKEDELFTQLRSGIVFHWQEQENGPPKLMSKLPNGKVVFPDRSEKLEEIKPFIPYICLIYEREREAFAKIICEEYEPKIIIHPNRNVTAVWKEKGNKVRRWLVGPLPSFEERVVAAIKRFEELGFTEARIKFVANERKYR